MIVVTYGINILILCRKSSGKRDCSNRDPVHLHHSWLELVYLTACRQGGLNWRSVNFHSFWLECVTLACRLGWLNWSASLLCRKSSGKRSCWNRDPVQLHYFSPELVLTTCRVGWLNWSAFPSSLPFLFFSSFSRQPVLWTESRRRERIFSLKSVPVFPTKKQPAFFSFSPGLECVNRGVGCWREIFPDFVAAKFPGINIIKVRDIYMGEVVELRKKKIFSRRFHSMIPQSDGCQFTSGSFGLLMRIWLSSLRVWIKFWLFYFFVFLFYLFF